MNNLLSITLAVITSTSPLINLQVIKGDCYITIVSQKNWTLYQSGNCKNWWKLYSGGPMIPGSIQVFQGVDRGWAEFVDRSFYKVVGVETSNVR